jgi:Tfp pilus assembly protein PilX
MPLLSRGRDERGFTMVTVIITTLVVMLLSVAALSAAQNDLPAGKHDTDRKIAYAAAEAGVQNYLYHLVDDPTYWSKCTTVGTAVNNTWDGTSTRKWAPVSLGSRARYTIELLPANGAAACLPSSPEATMIDATAGTFRIRVTGQALNADGVTGVKRTIVVNLRRESLLDYVYFTDKEVLDPSLYAINTGGKTTNRVVGGSQDVRQWAPTACARYYGDDPAVGNRAGQVFSGSGGSSLKTGLLDGSTWRAFSLSCQEITFATSDAVKGPFHTNDEILCQSGSSTGPKFGRLPSERVEVATAGETAAAPAGYRGCSPPYVNIGTRVTKADAGTLKTRADGVGKLDLPKTNLALKTDTAAAYRFVGKVTVLMSGTQMTITGQREDGTQLTNSTQPLPADGVLYVANGASPACPPYNPIATTTTSTGCGNLEISGNYSVNVTFTAENDIIVKDSTTRVSGSEALLGLIATGFVRVYHPVTTPVFTALPTPSTAGAVTSVSASCSNSTSPSNIRIDASILALTHSFIVDNYYCGSTLGTLTVYGAIVQAYRGTVGTSSGNGYSSKDYTYDPRLKSRAPPKFLDPVAAAWHTQTYNEQIPAR